MDDLRAALVWLTAGVVGMASLVVVVLFGLATGLAAMIVVSSPLLAGGAWRLHVLGISGLLSGFGVLWLLLAAGELGAGVTPSPTLGGYAGLFAVGGGVLGLGVFLGLSQVAGVRRQSLAGSANHALPRSSRYSSPTDSARSAPAVPGAGGRSPAIDRGDHSTPSNDVHAMSPPTVS